MATSLEDLRKAAIEVLENPGVTIDFQLQGHHIRTKDYKEIGELIANHCIKFASSSDSSATDMQYDSEKNQFEIPPGSTLDPRKEVVRALLIHEATHAIQDLRQWRDMSPLTCEAAAFIAQVIYAHEHAGAIQTSLDYREGQIFKEAARVMIAKELLDKKGVNLQFSDYEELRNVIFECPKYRTAKYKQTTSPSHQGIRRPSEQRPSR